jgi:hypothetical protein
LNIDCTVLTSHYIMAIQGRLRNQFSYPTQPLSVNDVEIQPYVTTCLRVVVSTYPEMCHVTSQTIRTAVQRIYEYASSR